MAETRKLAAILAADVVGYSRLAGVDENLTLARLRALRSDLVDPNIAVHNGRVVKSTGDGVLAEFRSVVDAVRCGVEIQSGLMERNAGLPSERRIEFRVGIHVGDVVEEADGDLMGNGVNIAARLEGIANPGAICMSEDAYRQVKGQLDLAVKDLGPRQLKNIAEPVHSYMLDVHERARKGLVRTAPGRRGFLRSLVIGAGALILVAGCLWYFIGSNRFSPLTLHAPAPPARLSLVVLPFSNLSGDQSQDYLGDVLTEELTTSLSRLPGSFVVSRTTAFTYRGKTKDVKQIGNELGVRYALEGSVQRSKARIRVTAQLIDTETAAHLWADQFDFDSNPADLLAMQDAIVARLTRTLHIELTSVEAIRVARTHPDNPGAEELGMQCEAAYLRKGIIRMGSAFDVCQRAVEVGDQNVRALAILALRSLVHVTDLSSADPRADLQRADQLISRALAIDPNDYLVHYVNAYALAFRRPDEAIEEAERTFALNPSYVMGYHVLWIADFVSGRPESANKHLDVALEMSPHDPLAYAFLRDQGFGLFAQSRYADATGSLERSVAINPEEVAAYVLLVASQALAGQKEEARKTLERYLARQVDKAMTIKELKRRQPFESPFLIEVYDRVYQGLRMAGMPE